MTCRAHRWVPTLVLAGLLCQCSKEHEPGLEKTGVVELGKSTLRLLVLTDLDGAVEPCGCVSRPLGGLDHLVHAVEQASKNGPRSLVVSAGNTFYEGCADRHPENDFAAETLAKALNRLSMAAAAPGSADLCSDPATLTTLSSQANVSFVAAGVKLSETTSENLSRQFAARRLPGIKPNKVVALSGLSVGLIGVVETPRGGLPQGVSSPSDPVAQARLQVERLRRNRTDLVLLLVSGGAALAQRLARDTDADIVVYAADQDRYSIAAQHGALILNAGRKGQGMLVVDVWWSGANDDLQLVPSDAPSNRQRPSNLASGRYVAFDEKAGRDPKIGALLEAHAKRVNEYNRRTSKARPPPVPEGGSGYVGSRPCASCHTAAYVWWKASPHGRAYATLEQRSKEYHLACVGCHVTGYEKPGGSTVASVEHLKNVGCESCHGPGSAHVNDPRPPHRHIHRVVAEEVCRQCHNPEHSDRFEYAAYREKLIAKGHGAPR